MLKFRYPLEKDHTYNMTLDAQVKRYLPDLFNFFYKSFLICSCFTWKQSNNIFHGLSGSNVVFTVFQGLEYFQILGLSRHMQTLYIGLVSTGQYGAVNTVMGTHLFISSSTVPVIFLNMPITLAWLSPWTFSPLT